MSPEEFQAARTRVEAFAREFQANPTSGTPGEADEALRDLCAIAGHSYSECLGVLVERMIRRCVSDSAA